MGVHTFEPSEGWVPANTEGSVWCYRARGNAGVLAFRHTEDGQPLYEATHQDCYASDETITTRQRVDAVRFAVAGAGAAPPPAAAADTRSEADELTRLETTPALPIRAEREAMRMAWHHYIDATSELLEQVRANLDQAGQGELLGTVDQALALVREGALEAPAARSSSVELLSVTVSAVMRKAHELIAVG
jgi:hypothetical protein